MTLEETQVPEAEVTVATETEQAAAPSSDDDDAAFEQGFNDVEAPAPEPEPEPEPESDPPAAPEPPPEPEFQLTSAQAKELYEKSQRFEQQVSKAFGTIGALKQQIDQLKAAPQPSQAAIKLTADKLKRLHAEFPEMAAMLSEDLNEALAVAPTADVPPPPVGVPDLEQKFNERLEQMSREKEQKLLTIAHKDWTNVVSSPEFNAWKEKLPTADREQLDTSWDAVFIADKISEFKDWKNKTVQTTQAKRTRLEAAITPRGNPQRPPAPSDDDAFVQGFNSA